MGCPVCFDKTAKQIGSAEGKIETECRRCGRFKYTQEAWNKLRTAPPEKRALVCGSLWEQNRYGSVPTIDVPDVDALFSATPIPFIEKAKRLLIHLSEQSNRLGVAFDLGSQRLDAMLETLHHNDVNFVNEFLVDRRWVENTTGQFCLTGSGFIQADEWKRTSASSGQGFIAMWFADALRDAWTDGLEKGVKAAGYKPLRIDNKEHRNKICDEIIAEIRRSRFIVADYTGHRAGVYYEAGYADGRDLPVFSTCRKDEMKDLHFDVRQYNCIDWETPAELARRLQIRIEAVLGDGPFKRPAPGAGTSATSPLTLGSSPR
jgi:hypothetical protein